MSRAEPSTPDPLETLRLDDALKLAGVATTGGEAKVMIQGGAVRVNGAVETRRKRRLVEGDVVEVGDETFEIALTEDDDGAEDGTEHDGAAAAAAAAGAGAGADVDAVDTAPGRDGDEAPWPIQAPGAGDLDDEGEDEDDDDGWGDDGDDDEDEDEPIEFVTGDLDDEDDGAMRLDPTEQGRWAAWVTDRVAADDVDAVIIRLGGLHPDALEAVFARLDAEVEERVLDGLDAVLDGELEPDEDRPDPRGDAPLQA